MSSDTHTNRQCIFFSLITLFCLAAFWAMPRAHAAPAALNIHFLQQPDGLLIQTPRDELRIRVCNDSALRVTAIPGAAKVPATAAPWVLGSCSSTAFAVSIKDDAAELTTARIKVTISGNDGNLTFSNAAGSPILTESDGRSYDETPWSAEGIYRVSDSFFPVEDEGIYGLGQHQSGAYNYRGSFVYLSQKNTDVAVPFFLSTRGYGLLWNTASTSWFDNRYPNKLRLVATAAAGVDYYFFYGPDADQIIHQYRQLTGTAPLFARWAYGFFQSRDRYSSQEELLSVAENYRDQHIPVDAIVQDWFWWTKQGSNLFTPAYSEMGKTIKRLHERDHARLMISIWPAFDADAPIAVEMTKKNMIIPGTKTYDVSNPEARDLYWKMLAGPLFSLGVDAFWLDASEPEALDSNPAIEMNTKIFLGREAVYANSYPYLHTLGVYENWRRTTDAKRVFLLTRSAFAGSQHNAAATWSGDIYSTFWGLERQLPAGLNFALSGLPYWTLDIGGYGYPRYKSSDDPVFQELYTRWFEYGVFCPLFRTHGHRSNNRNELTSYGDKEPILLAYDRLRYRMLPYVYSLAAKVTREDYTIMRPLVMDWRQDKRVREIGDQFMFGPALMVAPVTRQGATSRTVYLPQTASWRDFWTGDAVQSGLRTAIAPFDRIPLYVRAGSILPLGPNIEYADEPTEEPIEIRVYPGADCNFLLYSDAGDSYRYEQGESAVIPLHWQDRAGKLTIGDRVGSYPGMKANLGFKVVLVGHGHGAGPKMTAVADRSVQYSGKKIDVSLRKR